MRLALLVLIVLIFAAPAHAGTIELKRSTYVDGSDSYVFVAAPGEHNQLVVERLAGAIRLTDTGAPLTGCTPDGPNAVRCERDLSVWIDAGDADDTVSGDYTSAAGGPGDDRLSATSSVGSYLDGGEGDDVLEGGPGMDTLTGGPGGDRATGGPGNDSFNMGSDGLVPAADVYDGGDGLDAAEYDTRRRPVRVDLQAGRGGGPGENDALANIENASGGAARDVLLGDAGPNELDGGEGSRTGDRLEGRGGDDYLEGGRGADHLIGGSGDDRLLGGQGDDRYDAGPGRDSLFLAASRGPRVRCGAGDDTIVNPSGARLPADCERVDNNGPLLRLERTATALRVSVRWDTSDYRLPCRVAVNGTIVRGLSSRRPKTVTLPRATGKVTVHASYRCRGRLGSLTAVTAFRLTS